MKLVLDEKLKHRLIGLAVILSLGAIFAPALMKKSNQRLENNLSVNVKLPPKPVAPEVSVSNEKELFNTVKVAKVEIPALVPESELPQLAKADTASSQTPGKSLNLEVAQNEAKISVEPPNMTVTKTAKITAKTAIRMASNQHRGTHHATTVAMRKNKLNQSLASKTAKTKEIYAVQLASFSQLTNAQILVNKLRNKGYKANFIKVAGRGGNVYKVFAGHSPHRAEVVKLKTQLASSMQLKGFIINTGVS